MEEIPEKLAVGRKPAAVPKPEGLRHAGHGCRWSTFESAELNYEGAGGGFPGLAGDIHGLDNDETLPAHDRFGFQSVQGFASRIYSFRM